jgi:hypothetical protein
MYFEALLAAKSLARPDGSLRSSHRPLLCGKGWRAHVPGEGAVAIEGQREGSVAESASVRRIVGAAERIEDAVREVLAGAFPQGLHAVVLTGSLARGEGTWLQENGRERLAGDAEFLAVFGEHDLLPSAGSIAAVERAVQNRLTELGLEVHIELSPVRPSYLRRLQPHIFAYELVEHGRVIWGDENILALAPRFSRADIPLEDGFFLLMNRIIELLEALCSPQGESLKCLLPTHCGMKISRLAESDSLALSSEGESLPRAAPATTWLAEGRLTNYNCQRSASHDVNETHQFDTDAPRSLPLIGERLGGGRLAPRLSEDTWAQAVCSEAVRYRAMKLWLDAATSFLLFQGQYESTYRRRAERLAQIASQAEAHPTEAIDAPITLSRFNERVALATEFKLGRAQRTAGVAGQPEAGGEDDLAGLINDTHSLWRWELARLTGTNRSASDDELLNRFITAQNIVPRMRGWAATAKRCGLRHSFRLLPRWSVLALKGSPRRLVYAAASQLFFALPAILRDGGPGWSERGIREHPDVARGRANTFRKEAVDKNEEGSYRELVRNLPVGESAAEASLRGVGRAIARNYHQFLQPTRS